jgi:hypothetical protein
MHRLPVDSFSHAILLSTAGRPCGRRAEPDEVDMIPRAEVRFTPSARLTCLA